ncbi:MAG: HDOD domain-containing protein [Planctomycetes bacterium]|nr:HDOD domain-containing protein [Planctomycetota bacterium]MCH8966087.1 HDOD domain-containing protein [Planctomycetota bacterium]
MNAAVLEAIKKSAAVPSMPQVVSRFLQVMEDPSFGYEDLVKVLSGDPGTVSEILRLVNSALFGVQNKVVSLRQALTLLGPKRTRSLVLGRYLVDTLSEGSVSGLDMSYFWRRSLAASVVASRFAERLLPRHRDETFIAALLADIGVPILAEAMPESYEKILLLYAPHGARLTPQKEQDAVGVTHGEVSAMVLNHWRLPGTIVDAVNLQHSEAPGEGDVATIARILNASDRIAKLLCEVTGAEHITTVCTEATELVGLDMTTLVELLPTIESDIEDLAEVLRIDVIPSSVYSLFAKAVQERLVVPTSP